MKLAALDFTGRAMSDASAQSRRCQGRGRESPAGSIALAIRGSVEAEGSDDDHHAPKQHAAQAAHLLPGQLFADEVRHAADSA